MRNPEGPGAFDPANVHPDANLMPPNETPKLETPHVTPEVNPHGQVGEKIVEAPPEISSVAVGKDNVDELTARLAAQENEFKQFDKKQEKNLSSLRKREVSESSKRDFADKERSQKRAQDDKTVGASMERQVKESEETIARFSRAPKNETANQNPNTPEANPSPETNSPPVSSGPDRNPNDIVGDIVRASNAAVIDDYERGRRANAPENKFTLEESRKFANPSFDPRYQTVESYVKAYIEDNKLNEEQIKDFVKRGKVPMDLSKGISKDLGYSVKQLEEMGNPIRNTFKSMAGENISPPASPEAPKTMKSSDPISEERIAKEVRNMFEMGGAIERPEAPSAERQAPRAAEPAAETAPERSSERPRLKELMSNATDEEREILSEVAKKYFMEKYGIRGFEGATSWETILSKRRDIAQLEKLTGEKIAFDNAPIGEMPKDLSRTVSETRSAPQAEAPARTSPAPAETPAPAERPTQAAQSPRVEAQPQIPTAPPAPEASAAQTGQTGPETPAPSTERAPSSETQGTPARMPESPSQTRPAASAQRIAESGPSTNEHTILYFSEDSSADEWLNKIISTLDRVPASEKKKRIKDINKNFKNQFKRKNQNTEYLAKLAEAQKRFNATVESRGWAKKGIFSRFGDLLSKFFKRKKAGAEAATPETPVSTPTAPAAPPIPGVTGPTAPVVPASPEAPASQESPEDRVRAILQDSNAEIEDVLEIVKEEMVGPSKTREISDNAAAKYMDVKEGMLNPSAEDLTANRPEGPR